MEQGIENQNLSRIVIKNSSYSLASVFIFKFGGLIFTILIARLLLPELFGIYALALSIITIFATFANFGLDETFLRYLSEALSEKNNKKARSYLKYLLKVKASLVASIVFLILLSSKFISQTIYHQPLLFYPLIFSCLFIIAESFKNFIAMIFVAIKNLKPAPFLELAHQIIKISFSVFAILVLSSEFKIAGLFLAAALGGFFHLFLFILILLKKNKSLFIGDTMSLNKKRINNYWKFVGVTTLSLIFFASIDTLMLGRFVESTYLGYYKAAMSLILTIASLLSLSNIFLPVFTQIHGKRFERGFQKTCRFLILLTIPATIGIIFLGKYLIKAVYGNEYLLGITSIYSLSFLIITTPLIGLYSIIFQSKEKPKVVSNAILISLVVNILFNVFVIFLFKNNPLFMIAGVGLATSLSRILLLGLLAFHAKKEFNFKIKGIGLGAPIFATTIMSVFLFLFNNLVNMNFFFGVMEIIFGAGIYLGVLILIKFVNKEDLDLIKNLGRS